MSKLISGKEALIALANGEEVQIKSNKQWVPVDNCQVYQFLNRDCSYKFRLKPRTITINGVEYIDKQGAYEAFMKVYNEMDIHPEI